jgi:PRTRC genetic system protein B
MRSHEQPQLDGILYFVGGQLLFEYKDEKGAVIRKCISPLSARQAFTLERIDSGWMAPNIIRYGENQNGPWFLQRHEATHYTLTLDPPLKLSNLADGLRQLCVPLPGFVFLGMKRTYYLWAYREWQAEKTALYEAPLPNVYPNGHICFGKSRPPMVNGQSIEQAWHLFWNSPFTHDLIRGKSKRFSKNVLALLATLHQPTLNAAARFPIEELQEARVTVGDVLRQLNDQKDDHS